MLFLFSDSKNLEFDTALSSHSALFWEAQPTKMNVHKKIKKSLMEPLASATSGV